MRIAAMLPCLLLAMLPAAAFADPPPVHRGAVEARAEAMFLAADTDHDGWLTRAEYHAALARIVKARGGTPTARGWALVDAAFDAVDTGHRGRLSERAFVDAAMGHFDGADLNHDGIVTPAEARKAAELTRKLHKHPAG